MNFQPEIYAKSLAKLHSDMKPLAKLHFDLKFFSH